MKDRLSNGQFARKRAKTGGRKKGTPNRTTRKVREFLASLVDRVEIQDAVADRIRAGDAVAFFRALEHVVGKPRETVDVDVKVQGDVLARLMAGRKRIEVDGKK